MPVTYSIEGDLLRLDLVGEYPSSDVMERLEEAVADPECPENVVLLVDVSRSDVIGSRPPAEIQRISEFLGRYAARIGRRCAVLAGTDVQYGMSRMGAVYSEAVGVESQVFRNLEDALAWLRAPSPARPDGPTGR